MSSSLKVAVRQMLASPAFSAVAVLTLALGIGACTAMFGVINAVLLRPLPFRAPDRLVWIENEGTSGLSARTTRADTFNAWREQNSSFEALGAYFAFFDFGRRQTLTGSGGNPERLRSVGVSDNFLDVLGVRLALGRNFTAEECRFNGPSVALLSDAFWRRRFHGDPDVVGRTLTLNNEATTIVGVLPRSFDFDAIFSPGNEIDLITPFPLTPETARWGNTVFGIGRLKPGVTAAQAEADLRNISQRFKRTINYGGTLGARVTPLDAALRGGFRQAFYVLAGAVLCVLAIACVNLSNLLLARTNARRQEFAVRVALGAGRADLIRQALVESLLLAAAGSLIAIPIAMWSTAALARLQTFGIPLLQDASVDPLALGVTIALTALAGVACGVLPAVHLSHAGGLQQQSTHQRSAGRSAATARNALVVAEVALACMLLVAAGLLLRSFTRLLQVDPGFRVDNLLTFEMNIPDRLTTPDARRAFYATFFERMQRLPGVVSVGGTTRIPLGSTSVSTSLQVEGRDVPAGERPTVEFRRAMHDYFSTMGIPVLRGRGFTKADGPTTPPVAVVNNSLARHVFGGEDVVGRHVRIGPGPSGAWMTIVGVVGDVKYRALPRNPTPDPDLYFPLSERSEVFSLAVRVAGAGGKDPAQMGNAMRARLKQYDAAMPVYSIATMDELVGQQLSASRFARSLMGTFAGLALLLALVGTYSVMSYLVAQRTQELGIRMALGARPRDIFAGVVLQGLLLGAAGAGAGIVGALLLRRTLGELLYEVSATSPAVLGTVALLIVGATVLACYIPARTATKVDPMVALRNE